MKNYLENIRCVLPYRGTWRDTLSARYISRWVALGWMVLGNPGNRVEAW